MKQINITNATSGMIVAKRIYDEKNRLLIQEGAKLTDTTLNKLKEMGFMNICVETKETEGIILNDAVPIAIKNKAANSVQKLDIVSIIESAKDIVEYIIENNNMPFDLIDIRNQKNYEYQHAVSVAEIAVEMGKFVTDENGRRLTHSSLIELAIAALLHDVGKRCSDRKVLEQLGLPKDTIEYTEELAPVFSYNLLKDSSLISSKARAAILFHKTDENGNNCPLKNMDKLKIHIFAKILHIANDYDTLITSRNKNGEIITSSEAIEYMMANCGTKYNLDLIKAFVHNIAVYPKGSKLELSDGRTGIVYENTTGQMLRPKLILEDGTKIDLYEYPNITIIGEYKEDEEINIKSK